MLLEAGRDHLYEHPLGEPLDHVRVTDIVDRLGLSIGAVYHYWDSQDDYRDDLLELLLSPEQFPAVQPCGRRRRDRRGRGPGLRGAGAHGGDDQLRGPRRHGRTGAPDAGP